MEWYTLIQLKLQNELYTSENVFKQHLISILNEENITFIKLSKKIQNCQVLGIYVHNIILLYF